MGKVTFKKGIEKEPWFEEWKAKHFPHLVKKAKKPEESGDVKP